MINETKKNPKAKKKSEVEARSMKTKNGSGRNKKLFD